MHARLARLRAAGSAGIATLEYAAAFGLAALLVISSLTSLNQVSLGGMVTTAVCRVKTAVDGGSCNPAETPTTPTDPTFDPKPTKCKITEHSEKVNSEIKIAFIKFGENAGFVETTYSDGTVTYTATDGAEVGVTGGFGGKLDVGKVERGAKVDFGAGLEFGYGSTWVFKDAKEAEAMKDQLNKYLTEQETLKHDSSGGYAIYLAIKGATEPPKPPNQSVSTFEVKLDAGGKIGLSLPWDPDPKADSGVPNLTLAEAGVKFGLSGKWTQIHDTKAKTTTYTTGGEAYAEGSAQVGPAKGVLKGLLGSSMAITRDENDQIVKVTLVTTREGKATGTLNSGQPNLGGSASDSDSASDVTVTTTSLDVKNDEQRALVDAWLAAQADPESGAVSPETYFPDRLVAGDPFQNLMFTNATVSNVQYDNVSDKQGFAAEVKLGVAFGIDLSLETSDSKAVDATYLDVPGTDGVRPPVDFAECEAK